MSSEVVNSRLFQLFQEPVAGPVRIHGDQWLFRVWAPAAESVDLQIVAPPQGLIAMTREGDYFQTIARVEPGTKYFYQIDGGRSLPDPASRFQPEGVSGPSAIVDPDFNWTDQHWFGWPLERYVIYELHVGTFTPEGTFDAAIPHLERLRGIGITAIEIMPAAQFSGNRNWGYDGVFPFAPQDTYGGPDGLRRLVDAAHGHGLAVVLDVVYNHLGPEGNIFGEFGPYFTDKYKTPWGASLNFDDPHSDEVRNYFIQNALYWVTAFHIDALRLDAVHAILDYSAVHILEEITQHVHDRATELNRRVYVIGESALNDTRLIRPAELGGYALDGQWNDDFHHSLHVLLTGERAGYYVDFGDFQHMAQAYAEGFVYSGRFSQSRLRRLGNSSRDVSPVKFVVYSQNHDQIGNRPYGERLSTLVSLEAFKLAQAAVLLSPYVPLIFMGDEYGETAPFQYFVSHSDPELIEAVRRGRKEEFASFVWASEPPDPQDAATFNESKLQHRLRSLPKHDMLLQYQKELIRLRQTLPPLKILRKDRMDVRAFENLKVLSVRRWVQQCEAIVLMNFNAESVTVGDALSSGRWIKAFDSSESRWGGSGTAIPNELDGPRALECRGYAVTVFVNCPLPTAEIGQ